jgi:hypothetical protein
MTVARFTDDKIEDKNMQRKVLRRLPGKEKHGMIQLMSENAEEGSIIHSIDIENRNNTDMSPITDDSTASLLNSDCKQKQNSSKNGQPVTIERWTDELEEQLIAASKTDIAIGDTAVERYEQRRMEDFKQAAPKFTEEQWASLNTEREQHATNQGLGGDS